MIKYLRCYHRSCNKLLTTEQLKKYGKCGNPLCGSLKFRVVPANSKFSIWEKYLIKTGQAHVYGGDQISRDPDELNYDNNAYWKRVKKEVGTKKANKRRALAINKHKRWSRDSK